MKNKWSLVVHQASQTSVSIWVGTLFSDLRKHNKCIVNLVDTNKNVVNTQKILKDDWQRPFKKLNNRFFKCITFENLSPNTKYLVEFKRCEQPIEDLKLDEKFLARGQFQTLPENLNQKDPFVVALGSCFYNEEDNGAAANAYQKLYFNGAKEAQPHVKFLTGDQVYLDIGLDSLSPVAKDIRNRIADDYASSWQMQRKMLRNGATWFLADDHEYWNNFPHTSGKNPYLWMITAFSRIKKIWQETAKNGVEQVQQVSLVRTFTIGSDLSFCLADCRSKRDKGEKPKKFMPSKDFQKVINWAKNLTSPGVIVLPQPLLVKKADAVDYNLASHTQQYQELVLAINESGHDIICLSGDVHFGRIASVPIGDKGAMLHEIISSPMSNLTGIDGKIATSTPSRLINFPAVKIKGLTPQKVQYHKHWAVETELVNKWYMPNYRKTKEHFMTLAFSKTDQGSIELQIQAWRVREKNKDTGLPTHEFNTPFSFKLN